MKINWMNTLFLTLSPLAAVVGLSYLFWQGGLHGETWLLAVVMALVSGIGITAGYHRLLSHKSYEATAPVRFLLLLLGAASFQNSALKWCSDHRRHHQYVDKDPDPYSIKKGFWHAHIGWIFFKNEKENYDNVPDLLADPLIRFQHRFYLPIAILTGFFLPMGISSLWGDPWGGFFLAGMARVVVNHHLTFSINSFCHWIGRQPYSEKDSSRDSWLLSFFTYGEGYHNFHHSFPTDYRNGIRAWHWDPSKWLIKVLAWLGQTKSLRRTAEEQILRAKLRMEEFRLKRKLEKASKPAVNFELLTNARLKFEEAYAQFRKMKMEYKRSKMPKMKEELTRAKQALLEAKHFWTTLSKTCAD